MSVTAPTRIPPFAHRVAIPVAIGLAVALVAWVATVFVFFSTNGTSVDILAPAALYFLPGAIVLAVLAAVFSVIGGYRDNFWTLIGALVVAPLSAFIGTGWSYVTNGGPVGEAFGSILGTFAGPNLIFIVLAVLSVIFVGPRVRSWLTGLSSKSRGAVVLVRQPSSRLSEGQVTHVDRKPVDLELADAQWDAYLLALEAAGFETVEVPASDDHPDSVFVEDTVVVFGATAVITSPGAESRQGETDALPEVLRAQGLNQHTIELPGTLDGGDVLTVGTTVYVGRSSRTNAEGIAQLRAIVTPLGYSVVAVPVTKTLHLKSAVTALPDGTLIGFPKLIDAPTLFDRFLAMPEPGAAVVVLSSDTVLMAASVPKSIALVESLGYRVVTVDVSEFEKLEGCVTCLSVRIR
jgi:dimethylargininase